jgi:AcrR family transcriptional regulator
MTTRPYKSALRAASSAATRERILDAAQACFEEQGFSGTTMRVVAQRAGTSLESVNLAGTKRELLMACVNRATAQGESEARLLDLPEPRAAFAVQDPAQALSNLMAWVAATNQRISRLWRSLEQAADVDPSIRDDYEALLERMRAEGARVVTELAKRGALRPDLPEAELADLLWLAVLPDQHRRLVGQARWTEQRYLQWLVWSANVSLLTPQPSASASSRSAG